MKNKGIAIGLRLITIIILSIVVSLLSLIQYMGLGVLGDMNPENRVSEFIVTNIQGEKINTNSNVFIQNGEGDLIVIDRIYPKVNIIELDIADVTADDLTGRIYYSYNGDVSELDSIDIKLRKGKNYVTINRKDLKALFFNLPIENAESVRINLITINPNYNIFKILIDSHQILILNILIFSFAFLILDWKDFFQSKSFPIGEYICRVILAFYCSKFFIINTNLFKGCIFLLLVILILIFLKKISSSENGELYDN